jgi:hypothetical protein
VYKQYLKIEAKFVCCETFWQERSKETINRLSTKTPEYQLGWAVLALSRQLDILKDSFCFM